VRFEKQFYLFIIVTTFSSQTTTTCLFLKALEYNDVLAKEIHDLEAEVASYSQAEGETSGLQAEGGSGGD
jgi:hypothetical protein